MTTDPYAPYLRQAEDFFIQGETVKAGQIWQAILKQHPSHPEARAGLMAVKERLLALREAATTAAPAQGADDGPEPEAQAPPVADPRSTAPGSTRPRDSGE